MAPLRPCVACTKVDDHPRHVMVLRDGSESPMHMDCCRMTRSCGVCATQLAEAGTVKGDELRDHLVSLPPRILDADGQEVS